ncbi:acetyl-CoA carboxylase carboxyl transferase subunit beta [Enterococcus faecalis]|uniref:acetyl-CoA carboxylase carboxyltransferase subunit beta n=1 Tax=Enterococcus faecalis TaxID=1351 RepID=UPI0015743695|nr:acetyl-CoA carboxylase carboxyltransferase subunit beta [Enterococcus faecalis]MCO5444687.1 acetyl-CoA carboxylase carboxyl transferase subunit beta [Enterococcus faecalis]NSN77229.1 acetyl-CoA carboxylase carboxyl transferase subunit beta [Enterococcus faecalis]HBI1552574.1 acetyl-CoA carboxylase carboxyl transferase subunit beta [Enterococcus faecalis]HBI1555439.1 acetyl-CoA carboxylase carboxyl transferase subunit beta [Enterococcus faecalis]HBI1558215.1 acetyl-CoA carboxylase carboxyl t
MVKKICLDDCVENSVPEEVICFECKKKSLKRILLEQYYICANCGKHLKIDPYIRIKLLTDLNSFVELFDDVREKKSVKMAEYQIKLNKAREKSEFQEAVVTGTARIDGKKLALAIMDVDFLMGTLGYVVGEKLALITEYATRHNMPLVIFSCSGGARVQEGITSLMQMEKVSMLLNLHDKKGLLYISVLLNPTAGGVAASFAMLGDINIAEPGAMIGFTGRRVIEQTIRKELPANFQTAEFQMERGFLDAIIPRTELRRFLNEMICSCLANTNSKVDETEDD